MITGQGVSTWAKITFGVIGGLLTALILSVIGVVLHKRGRPVNLAPDRQSWPPRNVNKHG